MSERVITLAIRAEQKINKYPLIPNPPKSNNIIKKSQKP